MIVMHHLNIRVTDTTSVMAQMQEGIYNHRALQGFYVSSRGFLGKLSTLRT
jgi:hypothetical protein